jgi:hypothetical protein
VSGGGGVLDPVISPRAEAPRDWNGNKILGQPLTSMGGCAQQKGQHYSYTVHSPNGLEDQQKIAIGAADVSN